MDFLPDPAQMTAEERFLEVAAILAWGYLRLRKASFRRQSPRTTASAGWTLGTQKDLHWEPG